MANRLVNNVVIVDSAMGNAFVLTSAGQVVSITEMKVATIAFWSSDTTGNLILSSATTTDAIIRLTNPNDDATTVIALLGGVYFKDMKVPAITAGTAWLYLS